LTEKVYNGYTALVLGILAFLSKPYLVLVNLSGKINLSFRGVVQYEDKK